MKRNADMNSGILWMDLFLLSSFFKLHYSHAFTCVIYVWELCATVLLMDELKNIEQKTNRQFFSSMVKSSCVRSLYLSLWFLIFYRSLSLSLLSALSMKIDRCLIYCGQTRNTTKDANRTVYGVPALISVLMSHTTFCKKINWFFSFDLMNVNMMAMKSCTVAR